MEITGFRWVRPREVLKMKLDAFTRRSVGAVVERVEGKGWPSVRSF